MKIDIPYTRCDRCARTSGRMSALIFNHVNGDYTKQWHVCWACEDDFWSWVEKKK